MSHEALTDNERREFLAGLGLSPDGDTLASAPRIETQVQIAGEIETEAPSRPRKAKVRLAPDGIDPHDMPVTDIVFDVHLLDGFPNLSGPHMSAASRHVFEFYKSRGRNRDRNSLLHRRIGEFIAQTRRSRDTGGFVKEKVKATKEQRDLAALLAEHHISAADLAELVRSRATEEAS